MSWLVLDTSTPIAVVGVVDGASSGAVLAEQRITEARRHAEGLLDAIDRALIVAGVELPALEGIAVGRGPGSFIGVRTGIATAKGLALGRALPLVGLPTLVALANSLDVDAASPGPGVPATQRDAPLGRGLAVVDAKRGEVYAQLVELDVGGARAVEPPQAMTPAAAAARAASLAFVVGAGLDAHVVDAGTRTAHIESARFFAMPAPTALGLARTLARKIARRVDDELVTLAPDYCRAPDAKLPAVDPSSRRALF